jgi:hypothetical protein
LIFHDESLPRAVRLRAETGPALKAEAVTVETVRRRSADVHSDFVARGRLTTPALVEKDDAVRPASYTVLRKSVTRDLNQGSPIVVREKSAANHVASRIPFRHPVKPFVRLLRESKYCNQIPYKNSLLGSDS